MLVERQLNPELMKENRFQRFFTERQMKRTLHETRDEMATYRLFEKLELSGTELGLFRIAFAGYYLKHNAHRPGRSLSDVERRAATLLLEYANDQARTMMTNPEQPAQSVLSHPTVQHMYHFYLGSLIESDTAIGSERGILPAAESIAQALANKKNGEINLKEQIERSVEALKTARNS